MAHALSIASPSRTARIVLWLDRVSGRPWFLPAVSAFPLCDYVAPVLPNQVLLLALTVLHPRRWWAFALAWVAAGALGAFLAAVAIQAAGPALLDTLFGGAPEPTGSAAVALDLIERWGLWALVPLSMLPWPPRTAVLLCAIAGLPPQGIAAATALGRALPVGVYALLGSRAPHLLRRIRSVDRVLRKIKDLRSKAPPSGPDPAMSVAAQRSHP